jgi:DNA-binding SARP family transcriptional activator/tetratricopeptide (TPR) repeat protein
VEFRILGTIELEVNGIPRDLGSVKERCVLAILLLELGRPVTKERIIGRLWGQDPPDTAISSLYTYVSRLRSYLRNATDQQVRIRCRSGSYTLEADAEVVDLYRFRKLRDGARELEGIDDQRAESLLRDAAALWRGPPLTGLNGVWATGTRVALEEERFTAVRRRIMLDLRLGRHTDLVPEISALVALHPLDQELIGYLMLALYRCGRQAEALEAFRDFRSRHIDEIGTEPGPELNELHQRVLSDDRRLSLESRAQLQSGRPPNSLPRDNPDFTGRAMELDGLFEVIHSGFGQTTVGVVAISGMPGAGKSALAIHVAHLLADSYPIQMYLDLHAHDPIEDPVDPASALGTLLRSLGVETDKMPADVGERAALWRTWLAGKRALIVLDDADNPDQIRPLLPGTPGCLVIITSRRRAIELPGVFWLPLKIMRPDEGAALFTRIAGESRADDLSAVATVVRMCGCLPLFIQVAASRLRNHPSWNVADLVAHLAHALSYLGQSGPLEPEIARSLELSYRYLTSRQQRMFRQLALNPGADFSVHAAAALVGDEHVEDDLYVMLDHHLLEEQIPDRFSFHNVIREYAAYLSTICDTPSERKEAVHRILDYFLFITDKADRIAHPYHRRLDVEVTYQLASVPRLDSLQAATGLMDAERANIIRIVRHIEVAEWPAHAALIPHAVARFLDSWGLWDDAVVANRRAVEAWQAMGDRSGEAMALTELCCILGRMGKHAEALECSDRALALYRGKNDLAGEADALDYTGLILWQSSRYLDALSCHDEAHRIRHTLDDQHGEADALSHGAISLRHIGRYHDSLDRLNQALEIYRKFDDRQGEYMSLNNIAAIQKDLGMLDDALMNFQQALAICRETGHRQRVAILLHNIGTLRQRAGNYDSSIRYLREALITYREIGDRRCESDALNNLGVSFRFQGHFDQAIESHEKALIIAHELDDSYQEARSHCHMGDVHLAMSNHDSALHDYRAALELSSRIGDAYHEGLARDGLGSVLIQTAGTADARGQWQEALSLFERIGVPEAEAVRTRLRTLCLGRHAVAFSDGERSGEAAWCAGRLYV